MPAASVPGVAPSVTVPVPPLLAMVALSQPLAPLPYAIEPRDSAPSDPPPAFWIATVWDDGAAPPCDALNDATVGDSASVGGDVVDVTVSVTVTCCGEFDAPVAVNGTVAVYVPAASVPSVTALVRTAGAEVVSSVAESQPEPPAPYAIVPMLRPVRLPPPEFVMFTFCDGGAVPPFAPVKERLLADSVITPALTADTSSDTDTDSGAFDAVGDVT